MSVSITGPTINGTLRPKGMPPRFYYVKQENASCGSQSQEPSQSASSSERGERPTSSPVTTNATDPPAWKQRCSLATGFGPCAGWYGIYCGAFALNPDRTWRNRRGTQWWPFDSIVDAQIALAACTVPPPGWKEETCSMIPESKPPFSSSSTSSALTQDGGLATSVQSGQSDSSPAPRPRLRDAGEVAEDLSDAEFFDEDGEMKRKKAVITAVRVEALEWLRDRFFSKGLGYAGEVIEQAIKELEAQ